ncbi:MAG: peptide deformylase [candidate division WOR-3 bacterium]
MDQETASSRRVVCYGNPVLRTKGGLVTELTDDVRQLMAILKATVVKEDGIGLAANQIGEPVQVFAVNPAGADVDARPYCVINPTVIATEGAVEREEGCLSIPGVYDVVSRPELVRVRCLDENGRPVELEATGLMARTFLHEIDHLNGILFVDLLGKTRRRLLADRLKQLELQEAMASTSEKSHR